jgi:hypothetical protein
MNILPVGIEELRNTKYDIIVATYPRSGANFLVNHIEKNIDINFCYTHKTPINKKNNIITVARDPKESITSWVAMGLYFDYIEDKYKDDNIRLYIEGAIRKYDLFYNYAYNSANLVLDFKELIANPHEGILKICTKFNFNIIEKLVSSEVTDDIENGRISSSKDTLFYGVVLKELESYDLQPSYQKYNMLLTKLYK